MIAADDPAAGGLLFATRPAVPTPFRRQPAVAATPDGRLAGMCVVPGRATVGVLRVLRKYWSRNYPVRQRIPEIHVAVEVSERRVLQLVSMKLPQHPPVGVFV